MNKYSDLNITKESIDIDAIITELHKRLSKYRQGKQDLIARMATEWPDWSCGLDFFTSFIHPLLRNTLVLHFINLSDGIDIHKTSIEFYFGKKNDEGYEFTQMMEKLVSYAQKDKSHNISLADYVFPNESNDYYFDREHSQINLISVRDADIGVHAFFSLFEGIIRNSAKHGDKINHSKPFIIQVVFWEKYQDFLHLAGAEIPNDIELYSGFSISVSYDITNDKNDMEITKKANNGKDIGLKNLIRNLLNEEIIDKITGTLNPGSWGLKEIKSCAAFLSGKKIQDVNTRNTDDFFVVAATSQNWKDVKERLIYGIKLERVRYLLVVVDDEKKPGAYDLNNWLRMGIKFVNIDELLNPELNIDYEFFVWDFGVFDNLQAINNRCLPQRQLQIAFKENRFKTFTDNIAYEFIYEVYHEWFKKIRLDSEKLNLIIYFEDKSTSTNWTKLGTDHFPLKAEELIDDILRNKNCFVLSRHTGFEEILDSDSKIKSNPSDFIQYFQKVSYVDLFFSFLMSLDPTSPLTKIVLMQVKESCFFKILVIDERITQILSTKKQEVKDLSLMGIDIAKNVIIDSQMFPPKNEDELGEGEALMKSIVFPNALHSYNLVFIHATRLNEIFEAAQISGFPNDKEEFIKLQYENSKHGFFKIFVHSGRGKTEGDIPGNTPFIEYSILQKYLIQEPSKFYLTQIALNIH